MKTLQWMITGRCNLRCRHCYLSGDRGPEGEPSTEKLLRLTDRMAAEGVEETVLTGGEPLTRPDFLLLAREMRERGIRIIRVNTNGTLLTEELLSGLAALGQRPAFTISYDGDGGAHDGLRAGRGLGERALAAFRLCRDAGFETLADLTVHRGNAKALGSSIRTLSECGCGSIRVVPLYPLGNGAAERERTLRGEEFLDLVCETVTLYIREGIRSGLELSDLFRGRGPGGGWTMPVLAAEKSGHPERFSLCRRNGEIPFLSAEGKLMTCPAMAVLEKEAGSFLSVEESFAAAAESPAFRRLTGYTAEEQMKRNPVCGACPHGRVCGGGCRAAALAFEGSFSGRDPYTCAFFRGNGRERIRAAVAEGMWQRILRERTGERNGTA